MSEQPRVLAHTVVDGAVNAQDDGPAVAARCEAVLFVWLVKLGLKAGDHIVVIRFVGGETPPSETDPDE